MCLSYKHFNVIKRVPNCIIKRRQQKERAALNNAAAKAFFSHFCMFAIFDADINLRIVFKKDFDSDLLLSKAATVKNNLKQLHKGCFN